MSKFTTSLNTDTENHTINKWGDFCKWKKYIISKSVVSLLEY